MPTHEEKPAAESAANAQPIGKRKRKQKRKLAAARAAKASPKKIKPNASAEAEVRRHARRAGLGACQGRGIGEAWRRVKAARACKSRRPQSFATLLLLRFLICPLLRLNPFFSFTMHIHTEATP